MYSIPQLPIVFKYNYVSYYYFIFFSMLLLQKFNQWESAHQAKFWKN